MDDCSAVADCCRAVFEDHQSDQGFSSDDFFIGDESDETSDPKAQWYQCMPRGPWIGHASPGDWDEKRCRG